MKTKNSLRIFFTAVLVLGTGAIHAQTKMYVHQSKGSSVEYNIADIDSISFTPRAQHPGLYMEEGILKHNGKAYRGIGVNFFGAFCSYFVDNNKEFNEIFALLAGYGIEYCRINVGLYWPVNYTKWNNNKELYFERLDEVIRSAEQNHIGIIGSFFWHW